MWPLVVVLLLSSACCGEWPFAPGSSLLALQLAASAAPPRACVGCAQGGPAAPWKGWPGRRTRGPCTPLCERGRAPRVIRHPLPSFFAFALFPLLSVWKRGSLLPRSLHLQMHTPRKTPDRAPRTEINCREKGRDRKRVGGSR